MEHINIPHLCGGTFYALVLQARKTRRKARDKQKGGTDSLTAKDVFAGLTKILTGEDIPTEGGTLAKCASLYKTCQDSSGVYVPFTDQATASAFDSAVKVKNPVIYARMTEFIETYLNETKCEWLVRALVDTIQKDSAISDEQLFDVDYNYTVRKIDLISMKSFVLQPFFVSVLHYIVMNAPDAESGRPTFEAWFKQSGKKAEWKYCGSAGESINPLQVRMEDIGQATGEDDWEDDSDEEENYSGKTPLLVQEPDVMPDLSAVLNSKIYMVDNDLLEDEDEDEDEADPERPFAKYLTGASDYCNDKKTLLNLEKPRPFYDLFVCNDLKYHRVRGVGFRDTKPEIVIQNGTISKLEEQSKYIIIEGTGGIGKSMYLTHLFLSGAREYTKTGILPLFLFLKEYKESTLNVLDFILAAVRAYDPAITQQNVIGALENKRAVLLLDGMDELKSVVRDNFFEDLEAFIKMYPGNTVIMTSRPVYDFVSYSRFSLFDLQPLTKPQALELIRKIEFWDETSQRDFMTALESHLYDSHRQFASNPLLLTIMLMTFAIFGDIPAKMHVFYAKAYETMARLHDATKGSYQRPLYSGITPEEFAKYYAAFCARTYIDEKLEFDEQSFTQYMNKVLKSTDARARGVTPKKMLRDLTDNLCIMYEEGQKYYFIHRSFQEYFAAFHFAYGFEDDLTKLGRFFDRGQHRSYSDRTFDMLYDMVPEKVERFVFYPILTELFEKWNENGKADEYWGFLKDQYPTIIVEYGEAEGYINSPQSYIYDKAIHAHDIWYYCDLDEVEWPDQINRLNTKNYYRIYRNFSDIYDFEEYPDPMAVPESLLDDMTTTCEEEIPYRYIEYFGEPELAGQSIEVDMVLISENPALYKDLADAIQGENFPLLKEYLELRKYYARLAAQKKKAEKSDELFDD